MPTRVRLDSRTESLLNRLARKKRWTKSEVIREAVIALARSEDAKPGRTLYEALEPLIRRLKGDGPKDLSERTGEKFRAILIEKQRKRR